MEVSNGALSHGSPCGSPNSLVENALEVPLRQRRAFQVLLSPDFPADLQGLLVLHGRRAHLAHALLGRLVVAEIKLCTDEDDWNAGRVMFNFWCPLNKVRWLVAMMTISQKTRMTHLGLDVVKRRPADNGETNEEDVCLRIGERSKSVVVFLAGGVPKPEAYRLAIDHDIRRVVVEAVASDVSVGCSQGLHHQ